MTATPVKSKNHFSHSQTKWSEEADRSQNTTRGAAISVWWSEARQTTWQIVRNQEGGKYFSTHYLQYVAGASLFSVPLETLQLCCVLVFACVFFFWPLDPLSDCLLQPLPLPCSNLGLLVIDCQTSERNFPRRGDRMGRTLDGSCFASCWLRELVTSDARRAPAHDTEIDA